MMTSFVEIDSSNLFLFFDDLEKKFTCMKFPLERQTINKWER